MVVYIATREVDHEFTAILGVFSTEKLADKFIFNLEKDSADTYEVSEHKLINSIKSKS